MPELEIYRSIRMALVIQALRSRAAMRLSNRLGHTESFNKARHEWATCQFAMVDLRRMLYGG